MQSRDANFISGKPKPASIWRFPIILRPIPPRWKALQTAPQLENFRTDILESTIRDDQSLVDLACESVNRKAKAAGLSQTIDARAGLLDQRKTVTARNNFVRMGYKLIRKVDRHPLKLGLGRYWFAVTTIHPMGFVPAEGITPHRLKRISRFQQKLRSNLKAGGLEIGWIDISRNVSISGEVVWCCHVHSIVGVIATDRKAARKIVSSVYRVSIPNPHVYRPVDVRDTFLGRDFTKPDRSLAGWLAYASRSARMPLNLQREKRLKGPFARPEKRILRMVQMQPILGQFAKLSVGDRRILGGCRMETDRLVLTDPTICPPLTKKRDQRATIGNGEGG